LSHLLLRIARHVTGRALDGGDDLRVRAAADMIMPAVQ
jgi:hypothetical protein